MTPERPVILGLAHAPRIVRASPIQTEFIILASREDSREITRHWDSNLKATVPCSCTGICETRRSDHFVAGLTWYAPKTWEQVVLHFTDAGWSSLSNELQRMELKMLGVHGKWQRTSSAPNAGVRVILSGPSLCTHPPVDIGYTLQRRLGLSLDFFGRGEGPYASIEDVKSPTSDAAMSLAEIKGHDNKAGSKKPRADKPRVSKGCAPCHRRRAKDSP